MPANYGVVRSVLRQFSLEESLPHIWHYSRLVSQNVPLPSSYTYGRPGYWDRLPQTLFPHKVDLLVRELLLHADHWDTKQIKSLSRWDDLADAVNALRDFGDKSFDPHAGGGVRLTLHRLAQQQFPRFSLLTSPKMGRHLALYRTPAIREVFERNLGIGVDAYFLMAFAVIAGSLSRPHNNLRTDYTIVGLDPEQTKRFFDLIVGQRKEMRNKAIEVQRLDDQWEYAFNVFHYKPMISLDPNHPERAFCPVPAALEKRVVEGLYYDLVNAQGFDNAFGEAVDGLIGRMLRSLAPECEVFKPEALIIGKYRYDGSDWIIRKGNYDAHVECKAKRMSMSGRVADNVQALRKELAKLAEAIVQNYGNIQRSRQHGSQPGITERQHFNLVITLEDWLIFSDLTFDLLYELVVEQLGAARLSLDLLDEVPYRVMSFETAQHFCGAVKTHPMEEVIGASNDAKYGGMAFTHELQDRFPDVDYHGVGGFDADFDALVAPIVEASGFRKTAE